MIILAASELVHRCLRRTDNVMLILCCVGNEWKTRYDTQCEMNQQLAKQCLVLQDKVEESKKTVKESK